MQRPISDAPADPAPAVTPDELQTADLDEDVPELATHDGIDFRLPGYRGLQF